MGEYEKGIDFNHQGLEIALTNRVRNTLGHCYDRIGRAYLITNRTSDALVNLIEAQRISDELLVPRDQERRRTLVAQAYLQAGQTSKALENIVIARTIRS